MALSEPRRFVRRWPVQLFLLPIFYTLVLFLAAGRLDWFWGWLFVLLYFLSSLATLLFVRDPALIAEREQPGENAEEWDARLIRFYSLLMLLTLIGAGLDERLGWSPEYPLAVHVLGLLGLLFTAWLGNWAMQTNTYFSAYVRIQEDRGQTVIDQGPYRYLRHPGNLSMITWTIGVPLLLGSLWALLPAILATVIVIIRTQKEDELLQSELPGYPDYAARVPYRLLPGLW